MVPKDLDERRVWYLGFTYAGSEAPFLEPFLLKTFRSALNRCWRCYSWRLSADSSPDSTLCHLVVYSSLFGSTGAVSQGRLLASRGFQDGRWVVKSFAAAAAFVSEVFRGEEV